MRDAAGHFLPVTHRLFYLPDTTSDNSLRLALCLYTPQLFEPQATSVAVNSLTGEMIELGDRDDSRLLSDREKQVLRLIDQGMTSKRQFYRGLSGRPSFGHHLKKGNHQADDLARLGAPCHEQPRQ